jgi:hypothetical protein
MGTFDSIYQQKIRQLEEENIQLKRILSEQFQFVRDVTTPYAPEGQKASLFKHANGQHIVVSHGGNYNPRAEGEVQGQPHETAVFHSDEFGNLTGNPLMTLSGHHDHETVVRKFATQMGGNEGGEGVVDMPTNPFPVAPSNTIKPNPLSPYRTQPHSQNPYMKKIRKS